MLIAIISLFFLACNKDSFKGEIGICGNIPKKKLLRTYLDTMVHKTFEYDSLGRMIQIEYLSNRSDVYPVKEFEYNSSAELVKVKFWNIVDSLVYDNNGRLVEVNSYSETNDNWNKKIKYEYVDGKRVRGTVYYSGEYNGYVLFKYDELGNTTSRKYYIGIEPDTVLFEEHTCTYDRILNDYNVIFDVPVDMVQNSSLTLFYYYSMLMSSLPVKQSLHYTYDNSNCPVIAEVTNGVTSVFEFEYE